MRTGGEFLDVLKRGSRGKGRAKVRGGRRPDCKVVQFTESSVNNSKATLFKDSVVRGGIVHLSVSGNVVRERNGRS